MSTNTTEANANYAALHKQYLGLIRWMAVKYLRDNIDLDDLLQEAVIGLWQASLTFDPDRSSDFSTYAAQRMKSRLHGFIETNRQVMVPSQIQKARRHIYRLQDLLENFEAGENIISHHYHPTEDDLPEATRRSVRRLKKYLTTLAQNSLKSYEDFVQEALDGLHTGITIGDVELDHYLPPAQIPDIAEPEIYRYIYQLPRVEAAVVELRMQGQTASEIARKLNELKLTKTVVSRARIRQLWLQATKRLKRLALKP